MLTVQTDLVYRCSKAPPVQIYHPYQLTLSFFLFLSLNFQILSFFYHETVCSEESRHMYVTLYIDQLK